MTAPPISMSALLVLALPSCVYLGPEDLAAHTDADGDGFSQPEDCDDGHAGVHPGAPEVCDGVDEDCDGEIDEGLLPDADGDGYGDDDRAGEACYVGWISEGGDCDDTNADAWPGNAERCDGIDNGCARGWTAESERGAVTWEGATGIADWSADFAAGSVGVPAAITLEDGGTLTICAGTYNVYLTGGPLTDLSIVGVAIGDELPSLYGAGAAGAVIRAYGNDTGRLSISNLEITGGKAGPE